jgi:predicted Fe-Mo cluster-binding NifX family protein
MKIAVSATAGSLDAIVDPRFGRCAYFVIVEVEKNEIKNFEAIQNLKELGQEQLNCSTHSELK